MSEILMGWFLISAAVGASIWGSKGIEEGAAAALYLAGIGLIVSGVFR